MPIDPRPKTNGETLSKALKHFLNSRVCQETSKMTNFVKNLCVHKLCGILSLVVLATFGDNSFFHAYAL